VNKYFVGILNLWIALSTKNTKFNVQRINIHNSQYFVIRVESGITSIKHTNLEGWAIVTVYDEKQGLSGVRKQVPRVQTVPTENIKVLQGIIVIKVLQGIICH